MNVWVKRVGAVAGTAAVGALALVGYVWVASNKMLNATWDVPKARIEQPWPFDDADVQALEAERLAALSLPEGEPPPENLLAGLDLNQIRTDRARERGARLAVRLGCVECHGADLGGHVVMDVPPVMGLIAPNITSAALGGDYSVAEFERMVRHGVRRDGTTAFMPAIDYQGLSDQEVSDLFVYVASAPPSDKPSGQSYWGPVMRAMYAFGRVPALPAHRIDHKASHLKMPPPAAVTVEYGGHLARVCVGCHREDYTGGPIRDGDPSWPPAANLTPHAQGLEAWTVDDFLTLMRTGKRPDGRAVDPKGMPWETMGKLGDVELQAIYLYLRSLPPKPTGT